MSLTPLNLLILALATWRLAYMVAKEDGPFNVFAVMRARFTWLACIYCVSVYAALLVYAVLMSTLLPLAYILAGSGGAMLLYRYTGGEHI